MTQPGAEPAASPIRIQWREAEPLELPPILKASLECFYELGFHGASVREIASRAGVTMPSLYYHYQNKEGLLLALLRLSVEDLQARADAADADADGDPTRRLTNVVFAMVLQMTGRAKLASLEGEARYLTPDTRRQYAAARRGVQDLVLEIVRDGSDRAKFRVDDPVEITRAVLGMCQAIPRWYYAEGEMQPEVVARKYATIVCRMVGVAGPLDLPFGE